MLFFNKCYELWFCWPCLGLGFCLLKFHWNDVTRWICYIDKLTLCFVMFFFSHIIYSTVGLLCYYGSTIINIDNGIIYNKASNEWD
jgi:hypothetical protein